MEKSVSPYRILKKALELLEATPKSWAKSVSVWWIDYPAELPNYFTSWSWDSLADYYKTARAKKKECNLEFCSIGAIAMASSLLDASEDSKNQAEKILASTIDPKAPKALLYSSVLVVGKIIDFNDAKSTTRRQVLDTFRKAISEAKKLKRKATPNVN